MPSRTRCTERRRDTEDGRQKATGISTGNTPAGLQRRDYKENAENPASTHDKYPLKGSDIFTTYPLRVMVRCMRQVADQCAFTAGLVITGP